MAVINPYLNFAGTAEAAFLFYQSIFGGELFIQRMKDAPGMENIPEQEKNAVMHISLPIGNNVLMASDCIESSGQQLAPGNNLYLSYSPDSKADADRIFQSLSEGGTIEVPIQDMFWGDYFGSLRDKFGVYWMINYRKQ